MDVEASRQARLQKQQSRYRDRGGIFVPADTNPLLDLLLARGPNGESPTKTAPQVARNPTPSPVHNVPKGSAAKSKPAPTAKKSRGKPAASKAKPAALKASGSSKKDKGKQVEVDDEGDAAAESTRKPTTAKKRGKAQLRTADIEEGQDAQIPHAAEYSMGKDKSKRTTQLPLGPASDNDEDLPEPISPDTKRKRKQAEGSAGKKPTATKRRKVTGNESEAASSPLKPLTKAQKAKAIKQAATTASDRSDDDGPPLAILRKAKKASDAPGTVAGTKRTRADGDDASVVGVEDSPPPLKRRATRKQAVKDVKNEATTKSTHTNSEVEEDVVDTLQAPAKVVPPDTVDPASVKGRVQSRARLKDDKSKSGPGEKGKARAVPFDTEKKDGASTKKKNQGSADNMLKRVGSVELAEDPLIKKAAPRGAAVDPIKASAEEDDSPLTLGVSVEDVGQTVKTRKASSSQTKRGPNATVKDDDRASGPKKATTSELNASPRPKPSSEGKIPVVIVKSNSSSKPLKPPSKSLKPSNVQQKENNKTARGRKPKPRLSMFPVAAMVPDSDDDPIDFLS
ncbi:hypothetical protein EUX98_g3886 [Antrodiella citrinella]|uniref:Uncharacterized protein n=1 Tax=Antrodiella citrinella TaxID=2447956 RepID=A0A4S4MXW3_9APHY|nr:hypothetical protein EUX98_g3886 [Antrodiella citrinella]